VKGYSCKDTYWTQYLQYLVTGQQKHLQLSLSIALAMPHTNSRNTVITSSGNVKMMNELEDYLHTFSGTLQSEFQVDSI
jgi:hypothetical protein